MLSTSVVNAATHWTYSLVKVCMEKPRLSCSKFLYNEEDRITGHYLHAMYAFKERINCMEEAVNTLNGLLIRL